VFFYGKGLLEPRPTPKLEYHPSSAVRGCLFNLFTATLHIGGNSSIRNPRTRHAMVTGTHIHGIMVQYSPKYVWVWRFRGKILNQMTIVCLVGSNCKNWIVMHGMDTKTKCVRLCVFMCNYAKPRYSITISLTDVTSSPIMQSTVLTVAGTNLRLASG